MMIPLPPAQMPLQPTSPQGVPPVASPAPMAGPPQPVAPPGVMQTYDLQAGKYDLAVEAGPSYTTRREEAADMITTFIGAAPATAPILGPMLAKMSDWPEADKVSDLLATMMPPAAHAIFTGQPAPPQGPPPEVLAAQAKAQAEGVALQEKAKIQAALDLQCHQATIQMQRERMQADIAEQQARAAADLEIVRQKGAAELMIMRERAKAEMDLAQMKLAGQYIDQPGNQQLPQNPASGDPTQ